MKEIENIDQYLDLACEQKMYNMRITVIPIVFGALGDIPKWLESGLNHLAIGERIVTIQTTAVLKSARIFRRVQETEGDLLSLSLQWKPTS